MLDIETKLPLIAYPIQEEQSKKTIGVIELTNQKGIENIVFDNSTMIIPTNFH